MVAVTGRISGRDLGSTVADVKKCWIPAAVPAGSDYALGGLYEQQQIAFQGLLVVIVSAVVLVFPAAAISLREHSRRRSRCWRCRCWRWRRCSSVSGHGDRDQHHVHHGDDDDRGHRDGGGDFLSSWADVAELLKRTPEAPEAAKPNDQPPK